MSAGSRHEPFCTVLRLYNERIYRCLQESTFARQTRPRLFSLEAVQPRRRALTRLPVIFINRICNLGCSKRNQFATAGLSGESPKAQDHSGLGSSPWLPVCKWRRRNVFSQQSRVGWDCLPNADVGDLPTTPDSARFGSQRQQRGADGRAAERCQEDTGSAAAQRAIRSEGRWRLRSPNPGEHSRISEN